MVGPEDTEQKIQGAWQDPDRVLEQCINAQKLALVGSLAGGIAHNFNNLLMGIQGNASLLRVLMDPADPNIKKIDRMIEIVEQGTLMVRELLGFARSEAISSVPLKPNTLLKGTIAMFRRIRKELSITEDYAADLWRVEADRNQLIQVFLNLLLNASQAMLKAGEISVTTRNVPAGETEIEGSENVAGHRVKITVTDSGTGMNESVKCQAFDPFFTTRQPGQGYGLGLTTSREILAGLGGSLVIESTSPSGTVMAVYLPASQD